MELIKIYKKIIDTIGKGTFKYTEISIHHDTIEILTDEFVTAEKMAKIDKIIGKEGHIQPKGDAMFAIQYFFSKDD